MLQVIGVQRLAYEVGVAAGRLEAYEIQGDAFDAAGNPGARKDDREVGPLGHAETVVERK